MYSVDGMREIHLRTIRNVFERSKIGLTSLFKSWISARVCAGKFRIQSKHLGTIEIKHFDKDKKEAVCGQVDGEEGNDLSKTAMRKSLSNMVPSWEEHLKLIENFVNLVLIMCQVSLMGCA